MKSHFLLGALLLAPLTTFTANALDWNNSQSQDSINAICQGINGEFWVGTEDQGLWRRTRQGQWQQVGDEASLGDTTFTCLALDGKGRLWAGTSRGGVDVWDGQKWARFDRFKGPLSDRVNDLELDPRDGSIWMATDNGLCCYSDARGWSYPGVFESTSEQQKLARSSIAALAFDKAGHIYAAQSDGLLIYTQVNVHWTLQKLSGLTVPGQPGRFLQPTTPSGSQFLGGAIHDVTVDSYDQIWCATKWGICKSADSGKSWFFLRGADWQANVTGSADGLKPKNETAPVDLLGEDWVTKLEPTSDGKIWIGFREKGAEERDAKTGELVVLSSDDLKTTPQPNIGNWVRAILPMPNDRAIFGRFPGGISGFLGADIGQLPPRTLTQQPLPVKPDIPDATRLTELTKGLEAQTPLAVGDGTSLGLDRATRGDWIGRYGSGGAQLLGSLYGDGSYTVDGYSAHIETGPHRLTKSLDVYYYTADANSSNRNALIHPTRNVRWLSENNDGTWQETKYPTSWEGPDLWAVVTVPTGLQRLSLYWVNSDGHSGTTRQRDYTVSLFKTADNVESATKNAPLATTRFSDGWNGTYANFAVRGPAMYFVRVARDRSHVTKLSGLFFDRLDEQLPRPSWFKEQYFPTADPTTLAVPIPSTSQAQQLWQACNEATAKGIPASLERLMAYRAAQSEGISASQLQWWRIPLGLWMEADRVPFNSVGVTAPTPQ